MKCLKFSILILFVTMSAQAGDSCRDRYNGVPVNCFDQAYDDARNFGIDMNKVFEHKRENYGDCRLSNREKFSFSDGKQRYDVSYKSSGSRCIILGQQFQDELSMQPLLDSWFCGCEGYGAKSSLYP